MTNIYDTHSIAIILQCTIPSLLWDFFAHLYIICKHFVYIRTLWGLICMSNLWIAHLFQFHFKNIHNKNKTKIVNKQVFILKCRSQKAVPIENVTSFKEGFVGVVSMMSGLDFVLGVACQSLFSGEG